MSFFTKLPSDITQIILRFATIGSTENLEDWKAALLILQVCREWRVLTLPRLYGHVMVVALRKQTKVRQHTRQTQAINVLHTNIHLICKSKHRHLVKSLSIQTLHRQVKDVAKFLIDHIVLCDVEDIGHSLTATYPSPPKRSANWDISYEAVGALGKDIGLELTRLLPNITKLEYSTWSVASWGFNKNLLEGMAFVYGDQLMDITCSIPETIPNLSPACKLKKLDLKMQFDTISVPSNVHLIDPQHHRELRLSVHPLVPLQHLFCPNHSLHKIAFANLRKLVLTGREHTAVSRSRVLGDNIYNADNLDNTNNAYAMEFPKLSDLSISNFKLTSRDIDCLAQALLKRLSFKGLCTHFLSIWNHVTHNLDSLEVDLFGHSDESLISMLNGLFSSTQNIKVVKATIMIYRTVLNSRDISWPYLTHLDLTALIDFVDIPLVVQALPNIEDLTLSFLIASMTISEKAEAFFQNMRRQLQVPSSSKLHTMDISFEEHHMGDTYIEGLENLFWYYPRLQNLTVNDRRICKPN